MATRRLPDSLASADTTEAAGASNQIPTQGYPMRILVTGSLGTIGRRLTDELKQRGYEVFGCDISHDENEYGEHFGGSGTYRRCDVGVFRQIESVVRLARPDLVYHAAAEFGRWNGEDFYEQLWKTNVVGTKHVIRLQEEIGFKLVHFSSSEVYGDIRSLMIESEISGRMLNDYAMTKWVNEQQIANSNGKSVVIRLFNTYGPGERYSPYRSVNCKFLYQAMKGISLTVHEGHWRTSIYVDDVVSTLANIPERFNSGSTYNIGGDCQHSIEELAEEAKAAMDSSSEIFFKDSEPMTTMNKLPDISKATKELGHKVTVNLKKGMKLTAEWMKKEYA